MRDPTTIEGDALSEVAEHYALTGSASGFAHEFLGAWWHGVSSYDDEDISDVDAFEWQLDEDAA